MAKKEKDPFVKTVFAVFSRSKRGFKSNYGYSKDFSDARIYPSKRSLSANFSKGTFESSSDLVPIRINLSVDPDDLVLLTLGSENIQVGIGK